MSIGDINLYEGNGLKFYIRDKTSDIKAIKEVCEKQDYKRNYMLIESGERWLDAGANIGAFSIWASLKYGAICTGYEAEINNAEIARMNLGLNKISSKIHHAAIVPPDFQPETIELWMHNTEYGKWRHTAHRRNHNTSVIVPAIKFDTLLDDFDGVKLDIEGSEIAILEQVEEWGNVRKLVLEYHFDTDDRVSRYRNIVKRLESQFPNVRAGKIKEGIEHYKWFPPAKKIFAWR